MKENQQDTVEKYGVTAASWMPDGNGGFVPCPPLLTQDETIIFLRLDKQSADAVKTLKYYRDKKKLQATKIGKNLLYSKIELERFIEKMTG